MKLSFHILFLLMVTGLISHPVAREGAVRTDLGVKLFLKIITYDDNFNSKNTDSIIVYTIYDRSDPDSYGQYLEVKEFFAANPDLKVQSTSVVFRSVTVDAIDSLTGRPQDSVYRIALMTDLKTEEFDRLSTRCAANAIRTFSFDPSLVQSWAAVGLRIENGQPKILVNVDRSKREGSRYSAHLLKMCDIVEGNR